MRQRPRWQAYGAQQRSVALQVMVLHFTATDAASPAVATGLDRTIPAYAHAHTPTKATSHWIVLLILPPLVGYDVSRVAPLLPEANRTCQGLVSQAPQGGRTGEDLIDAAVRDGFAGLCARGDMRWELGADPNFDRLLEYEALLEHRRPSRRATG